VTSANFSQNEMPSRVENYVFNFLREKGDVKFYRFKDFEVDFVVSGNFGRIPVEVKYREKIEEKDYHNLIKLAGQFGSSKAVLVSKNLLDKRSFDGLVVATTPVSLLESVFQLE